MPSVYIKDLVSDLVLIQCFYPLILASNLFSTQPGVMPFSQNFLSFALSFLVFAFLVILAFNWDSWSSAVVNKLKIQPLFQMPILSIKAQRLGTEGNSGESCAAGNTSDAIALPSIPSRAFLFPYPGGHRIQSQDIETGTAFCNF